SDSEETVKDSFVNRSIAKSSNRFQSAPRTKRRTGTATAGLDQSCAGFQSEILLLLSLSIKIPVSFEFSANEISSPSRNALPSRPPNLARKSVERLSRTIGTSTPPDSASQDRQPIVARP